MIKNIIIIRFTLGFINSELVENTAKISASGQNLRKISEIYVVEIKC
jgi:hypothetical protein